MGSGLNLIPAELRRRRQRQRRIRLSVHATAGYLVLLLLGTLAFLGGQGTPAADAAARLAIDEQQIALLQQQTLEHQQALVDVERRLNGALALSDRPDWTTLLRLVAHAAGETILLNQTRVVSRGQGPAAGAEVTLAGIAPDPWSVSRFALRLEDHGLFDRVRIEASRPEPFRDRAATAFVLRCTLEPAVPDTAAAGPEANATAAPSRALR